MAVRFMGTFAPYRFREECTWCTATAYGNISSTSFGSCVGMVLWSPDHRIGVVAHFSGSMGAAIYHAQVQADALEILRSVCPISPGMWLGWVFGGMSLAGDPDLRTSAGGQTSGLIDLVRATMRTNPYIPINLMPSRRTAPEMQDGTYIPHRGVSLDVATGQITWDDTGISAVAKKSASSSSTKGRKDRFL